MAIAKEQLRQIISENDVKSVGDIYSLFKESFKDMLQELLEAEIVEANNIKPYDYSEYLLTEIPKHLDENNRHFCEELFPWSEKLPANCRK